jgi:hypothetical protein
MLAKHSDKHTKAATLFIEKEAVVLHAEVNLGEETYSFDLLTVAL